MPITKVEIHKDENDNLYCIRCKQFLPHASFYNDNTPVYVQKRNGKSIECAKCHYKRKRKQCYNYGQDLKRHLTKLFNGVKNRTNNGKGKDITLELDIDVPFLSNLFELQSGKCAISGFDMTYYVGGRGWNHTTVSIDRIDNNKGYTKENVQLVCATVNRMKSTLTMDEFLYYCQCIIKNLTNEKG